MLIVVVNMTLPSPKSIASRFALTPTRQSQILGQIEIAISDTEHDLTSLRVVSTSRACRFVAASISCAISKYKHVCSTASLLIVSLYTSETLSSLTYFSQSLLATSHQAFGSSSRVGTRARHLETFKNTAYIYFV